MTLSITLVCRNPVRGGDPSFATAAVDAAAVSTALAFPVVLGASKLHNLLGVALFLNDHDIVFVSLLHTLALVSTVAVAASGRHGDRLVGWGE